MIEKLEEEKRRTETNNEKKQGLCTNLRKYAVSVRLLQQHNKSPCNGIIIL